MLQKRIQSLFHPERYHGWGRKQRFFEGWYYKVVTANEKYSFAFIPGIAMDAEGKKQAFIQVLDGKTQTSEYIRFQATEFVTYSDKFLVTIEDNHFTSTSMQLALDDYMGKLNFSNGFPWPNHWYSPGIMGPFAFVPFMECYHGVLSMDHQIHGILKIKNREIDFNGGKGYIEKDWGHSFPSAYIWMQTNHFSQPGISLKASVAKIPWLGSSFAGFIAGVYANGQLIRFTTYNQSKLVRSNVGVKTVELVLENNNYLLEILVHRSKATELASPISGFMDGRISESMTSIIEVKLTDKRNKKIILNDTGRNTALEVAGKIEEITIV